MKARHRLALPSVPAMALLATLGIGSSPVWSYNVWNRPTDDTVCDLSPSTSLRLSSLTSTGVPANTQNEAEIYARLVLRTAAKHCKNGQVLILHSGMGLPLDASYFPRAANQLCAAADVRRQNVGTAQYPQAFEVRCTIVKMNEAREYITQLESQQTTEQLVIAGQPERARPRETNIWCMAGRAMGSGDALCGNDTAPPPPPPAPMPTDKPCMGAVIAGMGCGR